MHHFDRCTCCPLSKVTIFSQVDGVIVWIGHLCHLHRKHILDFEFFYETVNKLIAAHTIPCRDIISFCVKFQRGFSSGFASWKTSFGQSQPCYSAWSVCLDRGARLTLQLVMLVVLCQSTQGLQNVGYPIQYRKKVLVFLNAYPDEWITCNTKYATRNLAFFTV